MLLITRMLFLALLLLISSTVYAAEGDKIIDDYLVDLFAACATEKYCEGTWRSSGGTEHIVSVKCSNTTDTCTCNSTDNTVTCGGSTKDAPDNTTYVSGSCQSTYTSTSRNVLCDMLDLQ